MGAFTPNAGSSSARLMEACPVCSGTFAPLYTIDRFDPPLEILRCPSCGLERQAHFPELEALYSEGYYTGKSEYRYHDERQTERFDRFVWRDRLRTIGRYKQPPAHLLDVGCAFGGFLSEAQRQGYQVQGLDISDYAAAQARKSGLLVQTGQFGSGVFAPESFDVVTLIEVVEHLPDPLDFARALYSILKPGGLAVIQTANFSGRQARRAGKDYHYYLPGHLYYYSSANLIELLRKAGFSEFRLYRPVDFGLRAKLRKARGNRPLAALPRIALYHWLSLLAWGEWSYTSSMVLYARKG